MPHLATRILLSLGLAIIAGHDAPCPAVPRRQMENLNRGIVAIRQADGIYIGWRLLGTDPERTTFNLYHVPQDRPPEQVNDTPISGATNYLDPAADPNHALQYFVRPVLDGRERASSKPAKGRDIAYIEIPIHPITQYWPGDCSVGDLDGHGEAIAGVKGQEQD